MQSPTEVMVLIGSQFEEIECIAPVDLLRRAGATVTLVSCEEGLTLEGANGISITTNRRLREVEHTLFDCLVLPGGPGIRQLRGNKDVLQCIQKHAQAKRLIGAICAAPLLLKDAGVLEVPYTAHFSTSPQLPLIEFTKSVVENGNFITSQGPGTAIPFALALIARLSTQARADAIAKGICLA